ncbi:trans-aconitate methyltransferase [Streptomyces carminius]|uniref:Trans-aconitate methyltransferase n=1 Tax=Streptomyces carminius TaxID=2665496 RepID=A0A2M8M0R0_9ACTN|nr:methyltransferase domain-containing protein [Streptomyces carminius]PJE97067.1 trans-aconitate methyltransferase [Streptomyces carminius]PJE97776.1 trans-aconitate methyltransferase [Streptomyces carminius]
MDRKDASADHAPGTGAHDWDPEQYRYHAGPRLRPLYDLLARVPELPSPRPRIADLGCGPGGPTVLLAERWPAASITGYDLSEAMLSEARAYAGPLPGGGHLDFVHADLADWRPGHPHDLIISNAALHWVLPAEGKGRVLPAEGAEGKAVAERHAELLHRWVAALNPGGFLAFQIPGNFTAPSHTLLAGLRTSPRWRDRLGEDGTRVPVAEPAEYAALLAGLGCETDVWETTYVHVLTGEDPVLEWTRGTALRPVLTALDGDPAARDAFLTEYRDLLREAYPPGPHGTLFPFRRIFAVARRPG